VTAASGVGPGAPDMVGQVRRALLTPVRRAGGVLIPLVALALLAILIEALRPGSFTLDRLGLKSTEVMTLALVATGQTIVILRGGIDLSVGGTISLATAIVATRGDAAAALPWLAIIPLIGITIGLANGFIISVLQLQPFLVTLAMWSILEGLALLVLPSTAATVPDVWTSTVQSSIGGVPLPVVLLLALVAWWMWFRGTRPAQGIRAAGSSERAAFLNGVSPLRSDLAAYGLSGLFAALAGLFYAAKTGSGNPVVGTDYILPSIAAVVIGGASLMGGRGGVVGTIVGVLILNFIGDVVFLLKLPSYWQPVATGLILVAVVVVSATADAWAERSQEGAAP
jgi:ribose transport system permease protein